MWNTCIVFHTITFIHWVNVKCSYVKYNSEVFKQEFIALCPSHSLYMSNHDSVDIPGVLPGQTTIFKITNSMSERKKNTH
jgi:hypothetical protein